MGTCNQSIWSNIELGMIKIILEMFGIFCRKGEESSSDFLGACTFVRSRGGRGKLEGKDFPSGPAKRVRMGRVVVEGLLDFHRDLELYRNQHYIKSRPFKNLNKSY